MEKEILKAQQKGRIDPFKANDIYKLWLKICAHSSTRDQAQELATSHFRGVDHRNRKWFSILLLCLPLFGVSQNMKFKEISKEHITYDTLSFENNDGTLRLDIIANADTIVHDADFFTVGDKLILTINGRKTFLNDPWMYGECTGPVSGNQFRSQYYRAYWYEPIDYSEDKPVKCTYFIEYSLNPRTLDWAVEIEVRKPDKKVFTMGNSPLWCPFQSRNR